jgi:hypothetical protein
MKNKEKVSWYIFYGLSAVMVVTTLVTLTLATSWINKPFAGFLIYKFPYVGSFGIPSWPGYEAGLRFLDRIVAVDGHRIESGAEVVDLIRAKQPGTMVSYLAQSWGLTLQPSVSVTLFSLYDFLLVFLFPLFCGAVIFTLGLIVFILKPHTKTSWVFFVFCFSLAFYVTTGFEMQSTYYLVQIHYLMVPFVPAVLLHLGLIFPSQNRLLIRFPALEYLVYLPALLLILTYQIYLFTFKQSLETAFKWFPGYSTIATINRGFTMACLAGMIALVTYAYRKASVQMEKRRAEMILIGVFIAFFPFVLVTLLSVTSKYQLP